MHPVSGKRLLSESLSSWRAWIEISPELSQGSPAGCRSPHGERGLKCNMACVCRFYRPSLSSWRAWIEITKRRRTFFTKKQSLSSWRAWIEMSRKYGKLRMVSSRSPHGERGLKYRTNGRPPYRVRSLSSWRAWIEIPTNGPAIGATSVALLMESVD